VASYLIRGAHLLTMDGDSALDRGDVLIEDGRIADVAPSITAPAPRRSTGAT
jgi:cytosine/adenosine deaminase-related metal-dependent hydrolase